MNDTGPRGAKTWDPNAPALSAARARPVTGARVKVGATLAAKYVLRRALGGGGMGAVFAAENLWTGRAVAIKTLLPEHARDADLVERFWQEARSPSLLRHPHIVDVLDLGMDDETAMPFIVLELLEGGSLDDLLAASPRRRLSPAHALGILLPVMEALAACHEASILHRDVKPSNVLLARRADGAVVPKLIDFGIAKAMLAANVRRTQTGVTPGTPRYMSPESVRCQRDVDARGDVWSTGVTLFECLAGRFPFEGATIHVIVTQILRARAPRLRDVAPDVPEDLAAAVDRALEPDRERRYGTMREFIAALRACEGPLAQVPPSKALPPRSNTPTHHEAPPESAPSAAPVAAPPEEDAPVERPPLHSPLWAAGAAALLAIIVALEIGSATVVHPHSAPRANAAAPPPAQPAPTPAPAVAEPSSEAVAPGPAPAPLRARPRRLVTAARTVPTAVAQPPRPAPSVVAPPPAQPTDPLAPDETPYAQIQRP